MTRAVISKDAAAKDAAVRDRLRRLQGQLGGVVRMIDEGRECEDVVTQLMAVRAAIDKAAAEVVSAHVDECVRTLSRPRAQSAVRDAISLLARLS